ncbi:hypothetical protein PsYK624_077620 [Phanerochaete sordida]|uniref:Uncharacterized protein n=1 Tax=Phanerochaete sordida TaxID=48140 RepID=A0A9P3G997_9APHY|nr:hypothetical protein PsYK624_077620 [Phanerochaete sordida]
MKYTAVIAAFAATALAQGINIAAPAPNSSVFPGQFITVEVDRPTPLSSLAEVALVLSMERCSSNGCSSNVLGQILYNGPYNPQHHPEAGVGKPPHQNFSIPVPTSLAPGDTVSLIATHFDLIGAGPSPNIDTRFIPLNVVKGP